MVLPWGGSALVAEGQGHSAPTSLVEAIAMATARHVDGRLFACTTARWATWAKICPKKAHGKGNSDGDEGMEGGVTDLSSSLSDLVHCKLAVSPTEPKGKMSEMRCLD